MHSTHNANTFFVIICAVLLVFAVGWLVMKFSPRTSSLPSGRHWVIRLICLVWLIGTLGTITWHTIRDHQTSITPQATILKPSRPVAAIDTTAKKGYQPIDIPPCKFIITNFLIADASELPVWSQSQVIQWPEDQHKLFTLEYQWSDLTVRSDYMISRISYGGQDGGIRVGGSARYHTSSNNSSSSSGRAGDFIGELNEKQRNPTKFNTTGRRHALSICPKNAGTFRLLTHITRAAADDPLVECSAPDYLATIPEEPKTTTHHTQSGIRYESYKSPGAAMLSYMGPAAWLLFLAATACSQLLRPLRWANAISFAAMVLFSGGLDYIVMRMHAKEALDTSKPQYERQFASLQAQSSFFHQKTAEKILMEHN